VWARGARILTAPGERLTGLLSYVEQLERLRRSTAFSVPDEYFCAFRSEIDGLPGLSFDQAHGGDDVWLSLPRLGEIPPPEPSAALQPWIAFSKSADEAPRLRSEIVRKAGEEETRLTLTAFPGVSRLFENYLAQQWTPWSVDERPRRRAISLYNRLFSLHRRMEAESTDLPLELAWGMGIAVWKPEGGRGVVKCPLITQSCELTLDEDTLELVVRPREPPAVIELEPYAELESSGVAALEAIWTEHLKTSEQRPSPFAAPSTAPVLKAAIGYFDPAGRYDDTVGTAPVPEPGEHLLVTDSWVLFARRRTDRAWLEDVKRLKRRLKKDPLVPAALARLVAGAEASQLAPERAPLRGAHHPGQDLKAGELHFPLPYNDEQRAVAELLESGEGVVVDAPPGTGAAQTIANLICRCLARGQRVLVASPIDASLRRVQQKLPAELRPLSVAILAEERRGMRQLAHTIGSITERLKGLDPARLEQETVAQEAHVAELHATIAAFDEKLESFARSQLAAVTVDGTEMSPAELARLVAAQAAEHGWLTDPLDPVSQPAPRITAEDIAAVRAARIALGADLAHLGSRMPAVESLPEEAAVLTLHHDLLRARRLEAQVSSGTLLPLIDETPATLERAAKLRELLRREEVLRAEVAKDPFNWASRLRTRFEAREDHVARDLIIAARSVAVEELARRARQTPPVEAPPDAELSTDVVETVTRRAEGKFGFRIPLGRKEARASLEAMTVGGAKPANAEDWARVAAELEHRLKARRLLANWNAMVGECRLEAVKDTGPRAFRDLAARADYVLRVHELVTRVEAPIRTSVPAVFSAVTLRALPDYEDASHKLMAGNLASHLDKGQVAGASGRLKDALRALEPCSGPLVDSIWSFLTGSIGKDGSADSAAMLATTWRGLVAELRRVAELEPLLATVERVAAAIEASGAPGWAKRLRMLPATAYADPLTPASWREAWRWRVAVMLLGGLEGHDVLRQLLQRRRTAEGDLAKASRALTVDRAWLAVHRHAPERVRQAMREYTHSLRALGAGEGVRSTRNRQISEAALTRARAAVPCWLLPLWRVPEIAPAEIGSFDLVVIQDASRTDLAALGTLLRGRKLAFVGDAQQLGPPALGLSERKLRDLGSRFLKDLPYSAELAPGRSLLDLARAAFVGGVAFREQFGAAPEIVAFANREFYAGALAPLRVPKASQRLEPPLVDVCIEGAQRDGELNEAEALALVEEVESILADEALAGRTIGAVTLLGEEQAQRIERLLRQRVALRSIVDRRILTGTPAAFQGSERSLMLVSLGLAATDRGGAAATAPAAWFNLAASRALERVTLFRSIGEGALPADELPARLLRHFRDPLPRGADDGSAPRDRCETDLERELFDALHSRGFRVRPRVQIGPLIIDLVVDGADDRRVAVECDGDRADGAQRWPADLLRQRTLERVGWTFWRCFESNFVLRREHVLGDLWGMLERLGIEALGPAPAGRPASTASRVQQAAPTATREPASPPAAGAASTSRNRRRPRATH
jgi:very-short-patch-repair endonuclease